LLGIICQRQLTLTYGAYRCCWQSFIK
jgi:hypothetical protein